MTTSRLVANQYGKSEVRLVRIDRATPRHEVTDLNVSIALRGDLDATHLTGDNTNVLPTDTQKNTVYAFARDGVGQIEEFGLRLARHFTTFPTIAWAQVEISQYQWERMGPHSFRHTGAEARTARVVVDGDGETVESGLSGLVVMNTTDSEFAGYIRDTYTTLPDTRDRILATSVAARWRHRAPAGTGWETSFASVRGALLEAFARTYSRSLQQTLYSMGDRALSTNPEIDEITLSLPNKHHLIVDLSPFGLDNPGEVFVATDRPYGLIEGTVRRV